MQSSNQRTIESKRRTYYESALYLTLAIAVVGSFNIGYIYFYGYERASSMTIYVAAALATAFGLWVQSKFVRFVGAGWFLISTAVIFWPLFSSAKIVWSIGVVLFTAIGILSLAAAYILLLSKNFRTEFYAERDSQPPYKQTLRKAFVILLIIAASIATAFDIYNLANA